MLFFYSIFYHTFTISSKTYSIMPRKARFSREDIIAAGLRIVKERGYEAVSARALGKELGTSSSPMFTMFKDMNEIQEGIWAAAERLFYEHMEDFTEESTGETLSYHFTGIMSVLKSGREVENIKPQKVVRKP